ncbi:hypothetical protein THASP1DRAFT_23651 [Thamnocephalis sphaerospora]|uniref:Myb-like domain-containing protein n=1 Tax=Thamnocephalis sphaerospora TaxID=78915 RepID=A0A4V1IWQ0_9FUNG|nr:hypothetical protein THASP1DRAFT_23651 [Thamnocephalis sphaerospora]|eukprot:RKP08329.1 hypothetical protein THASP1DRAFT_23651 [Thamnocephalis sphaerospora]
MHNETDAEQASRKLKRKHKKRDKAEQEAGEHDGRRKHKKRRHKENSEADLQTAAEKSSTEDKTHKKKSKKDKKAKKAKYSEKESTEKSREHHSDLSPEVVADSDMDTDVEADEAEQSGAENATGTGSTETRQLSLLEIADSRWHRRRRMADAPKPLRPTPWGTLSGPGTYTLDESVQPLVAHGDLAADAVERRGELTREAEALRKRQRYIREANGIFITKYEQLEQMGIRARRGYVKYDESMNLIKEVERFRVEQGLDNEDIIAIIQQRMNITNRQYPNFWANICLICPDRPSALVMRHVRFVLDDTLHSRKWTPKESRKLIRWVYSDAYAMSTIARYTRTAALIAASLQRTWSLLEKRKLVRIVTEHIKDKHGDVQQFLRTKREEVYACIVWRDIAKKFTRRDAWQCRNSWRKMLQRVGSGAVDYNKSMTAETYTVMDDRNLLKCIYDTGAEREEDISWINIERDMNFKFDSISLRTRFWQLKLSLNDYRSKSFDGKWSLCVQDRVIVPDGDTYADENDSNSDSDSDNDSDA